MNGRLTIVFVSRSAGMLIRNCLQGAAVRAACQAKFLNTATLDAKKHSTESFACQDAFVFAVSSRGTRTHTGTGRFCLIQFAYLLESS